MSEIKFVDGLIAKAPREGAPDFLKCCLSIKREELIKWLTAQAGDWVNLDVKEGKTGKWYAAVNEWKPNKDKPTKVTPSSGGSEPDFVDDDPF